MRHSLCPKIRGEVYHWGSSGYPTCKRFLIRITVVRHAIFLIRMYLYYTNSTLGEGISIRQVTRFVHRFVPLPLFDWTDD